MGDVGDFLPVIPDDVKSARLGSGFDTVTGKLKSRGEAFHLRKLNKAGFYELIDGSVTTKYLVDTSSSEIESNSFFGTDSEAKVSCWGVSASVGASMDKEKSQANSTFSENLVLQSINTGGFMILRGITWMSDSVYNCTFDTFKHYYDAIMKATTKIEYVAAFKRFNDVYGDACVSKVHLIAGSALQITLRTDSSSQSSTHKYGAKASVSTVFGGVSDATNWGNGMREKYAGGTVDCTEVHFPKGAHKWPPTYKYIHDEYKRRAGKAIDQLFINDKVLDPEEEKEKQIENPLTFTAPEIEMDDGADETEKAPEKALSEDEMKKADDEDEKKQQKEDGDGDLRPEEYQKKKKNRNKKLKDKTTKKNGPTNVIKEARSAVKENKKIRLHSNNYNTNFLANSTRSDDKSSLYGDAQRGATAGGNEWDTGGFWVNGFETKKWTELFPQLERTFPPLDDSLIYVARMWLFLLTRFEFLQYLYILIDVGDDIADYWVHRWGVKADLKSTTGDAFIFSGLCDHLKKKIMAALDQSDFSEVDYFDLILGFEEQLNQNIQFSSMKVYETFFDNYDVFHENPLGFVQVSHMLGDEDEWYTAVANPIIKKIVGNTRLHTLLTDARRCYPVINVDGNAVMVGYQRGSGTQRGHFVVVSLSQAWDKGDIVTIRSPSGTGNNCLVTLKDNIVAEKQYVFLHPATNQNEDTRQWKFEKIGDYYAIKNIVTETYLDGMHKTTASKANRAYFEKALGIKVGVVPVTGRTPTATDLSLLWDVQNYYTVVKLRNIGSQWYLNGTSPDPDLGSIGEASVWNTNNPVDSVPGNFFQDFHKDPNPNVKLGREAYITTHGRNEPHFYGFDYDHLDINDGKMAGVPFLSRLPFDKVVSQIHPDDF
eukprot:CAMPEP_0170839634 /NCGR_PEP_ID=MMETSP0734-20130129/4104_1 /TAXON_ID=186038 /ORGANISM="Fragilariopsis kerguelensis, Strain L26-C5" /LENGTH=880 /DNA_ID=CAMNT_0011207299 /DNA_START=141 /DNA_END=2783 /DNA_ORIENTATION=+